MRGATIQRVASPTAMIVGLTEELANQCAATLVDGGLRVLKVGHAAAACERIPVVMPHLVVTTTMLRPDEEEALADRCVAVGAEILKVAPGTAMEVLEPTLRDAANTAIVRALRRGG